MLLNPARQFECATEEPPSRCPPPSYPRHILRPLCAPPSAAIVSASPAPTDDEGCSRPDAIATAPHLGPAAALMGEPTAAEGTRRRRRKLPDLASSIYRHVAGSKLAGAAAMAGAKAAQLPESGSWRERWFARWALGHSLSQGGLRLPRHLFRRPSKRKSRREAAAADEANYSTDTDDGGFKIGRRSPRKRNDCAGQSYSAGSLQYVGRRSVGAKGALNGGLACPEPPRGPVRRAAEDIVMYYDDDRITKSDSSLLSTGHCLLRNSADKHQGTKKKKSLASSGYRHSIYDPVYLLRNSGHRHVAGHQLQCHSVDSLPVACRHSSDTLTAPALFAASSTTLRSPSTTYSHPGVFLGSYLSSSCPGRTTYCRHDEPSNGSPTKHPSLVAYQPQVVSTPMVASNRQLSTNPSRRPTDFPGPLLDSGTAKVAVTDSRTPSPLVSNYTFWLSYELLNERQNAKRGASSPGAASRTSRNRLSLPLFSRSSSKSRRYSSRSSSMSSVHNLLTPSALPTKAATLALQQLLACYRNGDMTPEKISLLLDILDTQERFAKVIYILCIEIASPKGLPRGRGCRSGGNHLAFVYHHTPPPSSMLELLVPYYLCWFIQRVIELWS